jgi:hypothetical protein
VVERWSSDDGCGEWEGGLSARVFILLGSRFFILLGAGFHFSWLSVFILLGSRFSFLSALGSSFFSVFILLGFHSSRFFILLGSRFFILLGSGCVLGGRRSSDGEEVVERWSRGGRAMMVVGNGRVVCRLGFSFFSAGSVFGEGGEQFSFAFGYLLGFETVDDGGRDEDA